MLVCRGQSAGQIICDVDDAQPRPDRFLVIEAAATNILGHDIRDILDLASVEDGDDIRVLDGGGSPGFIENLLALFAVVLLDELDGDLALQAGVVVEIDLPHGTATQDPNSAIAAEFRRWRPSLAPALVHRTGATAFRPRVRRSPRAVMTLGDAR